MKFKEYEERRAEVESHLNGMGTSITELNRGKSQKLFDETLQMIIQHLTPIRAAQVILDTFEVNPNETRTD